jgi:hypothetical protein
MGALVRKHPLIAFFVLAYLLTWWIYPVLKISPLLGIFGLFGPALAAMIMAAITGGKAGLKALLSRVVRWRVGLPWYVIALGLPTVLSLVTAALAYVLGAPKLFQVGALTIFDVILLWIAFDGIRAADHRVFDLDDMGLPAHVGQRTDRHLVPRCDQPLPGPLPGWTGRSHPILAAQHRLRRRSHHRGCDAWLACSARVH